MQIIHFAEKIRHSYIKPKNQRLIAVFIDGILSEKKKQDRGVIILTAELEKDFGKEVPGPGRW